MDRQMLGQVGGFYIIERRAALVTPTLELRDRLHILLRVRANRDFSQLQRLSRIVLGRGKVAMELSLSFFF